MEDDAIEFVGIKTENGKLCFANCPLTECSEFFYCEHHWGPPCQDLYEPDGGTTYGHGEDQI